MVALGMEDGSFLGGAGDGLEDGDYYCLLRSFILQYLLFLPSFHSMTILIHFLVVEINFYLFCFLLYFIKSYMLDYCFSFTSSFSVLVPLYGSNILFSFFAGQKLFLCLQMDTMSYTLTYRFYCPLWHTVFW